MLSLDFNSGDVFKFIILYNSHPSLLTVSAFNEAWMHDFRNGIILSHFCNTYDYIFSANMSFLTQRCCFWKPQPMTLFSLLYAVSRRLCTRLCLFYSTFLGITFNAVNQKYFMTSFYCFVGFLIFSIIKNQQSKHLDIDWNTPASLLCAFDLADKPHSDSWSKQHMWSTQSTVRLDLYGDWFLRFKTE